MFLKNVVLHSKYLFSLFNTPTSFFLRSEAEHTTTSEVEAVGASFNNSDLYNAMMHPFTRMVIYGAIWYQGNL